MYKKKLLLLRSYQLFVVGYTPRDVAQIKRSDSLAFAYTIDEELKTHHHL